MSLFMGTCLRKGCSMLSLEEVFPSDEQRVIVTPASFIRPDDQVSVEGAEVLRRFLGIARQPADS
jgi:hypothetical protein